MTSPTFDDPMIEMVDVYKAFGTQRVLRGLSFQVERSGITCIIGRSGEGKSVLLKHILGLMLPDSGDVFIGGESISHASPRERRRMLRRFGMLFQYAALFDSMSVFDNVAFPLRESRRRLKRAELREIVESKLEVVGLAGQSHKMPSQLSGGQRKRVGLARAIALEPEIVLYDEPTTGLDPVRTAAIDRMILDTGQRLGITSVVITHDIGAALRIADWVAMLYQGRILAHARPDEIRDHPSEVIQAFIHGREMEDASVAQTRAEESP